MTSSLQFLPFHSILADPKDMHSMEKARLEMLLRKIAVSEWARCQTPSDSRSVRHSKPVQKRGRKGTVRDT